MVGVVSLVCLDGCGREAFESIFGTEDSGLVTRLSFDGCQDIV